MKGKLIQNKVDQEKEQIGSKKEKRKRIGNENNEENIFKNS